MRKSDKAGERKPLADAGQAIDPPANRTARPVFSLDIAIATWRRSMKLSRNFHAEDIRELEAHLRDRALELEESGLPLEEAYQLALSKLGTSPELETEYRKVRFGAGKRIRSARTELSWYWVMWKNYLTVAIRNIRKRPGYSLISMGGLSVGLACSLLLGALVVSELTYDEFHDRSEDIYRVLLEGNGRTYYQMPAPLADMLLETVPEVEQSLRFWEGGAFVTRGESQFGESVYMADPSFFEMLSFGLSSGDPFQALNTPHSVVLSAETAKKYFGNETAFGKTLTIVIGGIAEEFQITGVLGTFPRNSSLRPNLILPFSNMPKFLGPDYLARQDGENNQFVTIRHGVDLASVDPKLASIVTGFAGPDSGFRLFLDPFENFHLGDHRGGNGLIARKSADELSTLAMIALAILLIACFNFTILTLGRSFSRFREVGMRKVLGAHRGQLVTQFLHESWVVTVVATGVGVLLAIGLTTPFNSYLNTSISLGQFQTGPAIAVAVLALALIGILAGGYPSILLARLRTTEVFSGSLKFGGNSALSRLLMLTQLSLSIGFIIMALFIGKQLRYIAEKDLGFDKEALISVRIADRSQAERIVAHFNETVVGRAGIQGATASSYSFSGGGGSSMNVAHADTTLEVYYYRVDHNFLETMGIELVDGRTFSESMPGDVAGSVLVNEAYRREFGPEPVVGTRVPHSSGVLPPNPTVIGVVEDVHNLSLRWESIPIVFHLSPNQGLGTLFVRVAPTEIQESIQEIERGWREAYPEGPFAYRFLDEVIAERYEGQKKWARIYFMAALLGIFITCLGLFGLSSLAVSNRLKEVGIRKVMGASSFTIIFGLSREFLVLLLVAIMIAVPLSILPAQSFLDGFAYRISLQPGLFILAATMGLVAVSASVGIQAYWAAKASPVVSLRAD